MIPPKPFQSGPLLIVRLSYDLNPSKRNEGKTPSSIDSEGQRIVLCLNMRYLKCSMHTISPQKHCHQSPKPRGVKYALTLTMHVITHKSQSWIAQQKSTFHISALFMKT